MGALRERFRQFMRLKGFAEKTQQSYERAIVDVTKTYRCAPDLLSHEQIQAHLDMLIQQRHLAWSTVNVYCSAFQCFYGELLKWPAGRFSLPSRGRSRRRPVVLDRETVRRILEAPVNLKHRALLTLVFGSGLRVSEVVRLRPHHIESAEDRMVVRVEQGKGRKDRYTLLSRHSLELLRSYWREYRPGEWLFYGFDRSRPMARGSAQRIWYQACERAGVKEARGIHSLRHAFATQLLEQKVDLLTIKRCLGHSSLSTTAQYCHLTADHLRAVRSPADAIFPES